jgi:hypothetical protein
MHFATPPHYGGFFGEWHTVCVKTWCKSLWRKDLRQIGRRRFALSHLVARVYVKSYWYAIPIRIIATMNNSTLIILYPSQVAWMNTRSLTVRLVTSTNQFFPLPSSLTRELIIPTCTFPLVSTTLPYLPVRIEERILSRLFISFSFLLVNSSGHDSHETGEVRHSSYASHYPCEWYASAWYGTAR